MRKWMCFLLSVCLIWSLSGCSREELQDPGLFYYRTAETAFDTPDGVIAPEERELVGLKDDPQRLFDLYFAGPEGEDLVSPFPRDTRVLQWSMADGMLNLTMSDTFAAMTGVELTIACTCISRTMLELLPVEQVRFQARDALLGGEKSLVFSSENIRLADDCLDQARAVFTVYYSDSQMRYLLAQDLTVNLATEDDLIRCLVEALMTPPENSGLLSVIPYGTKLLDYTVSDGLCTLNFSGEFERNSRRKCEAQRLTLLSVVNTLTQLDEIQQVEFRLDGNLLVQYHLLSIATPLVFDEDVIGPVRTGMNEFDATLYLSNGTGPYLAAVPTRIRQTGGLTEAELVVQALLEYEAKNGFYSTIPEGTHLNSIAIRNGTCYLDLSDAFLEDQTHLVQSVYSIVASVCQLEDVRSVQISVNGDKPQGEYSWLFSTLSPKSDWFL